MGRDGGRERGGGGLAWPALRIAALLVVLSAIMLIFERKLIYFPQRAHDVTPRQLGLAFEDLTLTAEDGVRIHAWYLPPPGEPRWTVLFAHGNAGNVSHRLDRALFLQSRLGAAVLLFDYRGYGRSEGSPDEEGTYRDARAAHRWLVEEKRVPPDRLVIFGESLGSAVALDLALVPALPRARARVAVRVGPGDGAGGLPVPAAVAVRPHALRQRGEGSPAHGAPARAPRRP